MQDDTIQRALESYAQKHSDFADAADDDSSSGTFVEWPPKPPPPASLASVVHSNARIELPHDDVAPPVVIDADDVDDA